MPLAFDLLVTLVGLSILVLHTWATKGHFASERLNPGAVLIVVAVDSTAVIYSWMIWVWDRRSNGRGGIFRDATISR